MDWINEKFGCHCPMFNTGLEGSDATNLDSEPCERDHLLRPLLGCSFFIVALDVIASITTNISQQPSFLTATALTIHNSALMAAF